MHKKRDLTLFFLVFVVVSACVTVNIYFPAAEVQKAADEIVSDVRGTKSENAPVKEIEEKTKDKESLLKDRRLFFSSFVKPAFAQMDIEVSTPAIRSLKLSLKDRFSSLRPFYEEGRIGESNKGFIAIRDLEGLGLKEKSSLMKLVEDENKDRSALYKEILNANNLGPEHLSEIEKIFGNSWRKDVPQGWWIETDEGNWVKKK